MGLADALASWYNGSYEDEKKNENPKGSRGLPDGDTLCERLKLVQGEIENAAEAVE